MWRLLVGELRAWRDLSPDGSGERHVQQPIVFLTRRALLDIVKATLIFGGVKKSVRVAVRLSRTLFFCAFFDVNTTLSSWHWDVEMSDLFWAHSWLPAVPLGCWRGLTFRWCFRQMVVSFVC